jgi:23S rRNA (guanosine2251-2'-O)-methyltransferase
MKKLSMEDLQRISVEEFKATEKSKLYLILDDIRSMSNVGSVFRTADGFRTAKIFLCGITATPPHREIEKTALGATESVEWEYRESALDLIKELKEQGIRILALEQADHSIYLHDFRPEKECSYALILGNEVFGVNEALIEEADAVIEIPQFGTKHSFNVSVSAGMFQWDYFVKTMA